LLHIGWPGAVRCCIKINPEVGGEWLGQRVYLLAFVSISLMFLVLCYVGTFGRSETGVTSIIATVAIMFGYGQLVPASFFPSFEQERLDRANRLTVQKGQVTQVRFVVHNTGIVSWKNFRVSVEAVKYKSWLGCWSWISWIREWRLADGVTYSILNPSEQFNVFNDGTLVRFNANLLAIGEPTIRVFNIKAEEEGQYRFRIRVTNDGTPGEKHNYGLKLTVTAP